MQKEEVGVVGWGGACAGGKCAQSKTVIRKVCASSVKAVRRIGNSAQINANSARKL